MKSVAKFSVTAILLPAWLATLCACTPVNAVMPSPAVAENSTPTPEQLSISNGVLTLRQDLSRGGTISHLSAAGSDRNLINIHDEGRYIQQSYYAGERINRQAEGQSPSWSPWQWNPIQAGNYARKRARITKWQVTDTSTYVACVPMLWDMNNHPAEALMEQWTTLEGTRVHVRNKITCMRSANDPYGPARNNDQELPAVYPVASLHTLYAYLGNKPFTNDTLSRPEVIEIKLNTPGSFWGRYPNVTEKWMAFVDGSQWGLGVYSPSAERFLAGRFQNNPQGNELSAATSYIAPVKTVKLDRRSVFSYDYYLIVGKLPAIRSEVYAIRNNTKK